MTTYARPAGHRPIVVPLNAPAEPSTPPPAPDGPQACMGQAVDGACVEFAPSRRTGNIKLTLKPSAAADHAIEDDARKSSPPLKVAPLAMDFPKKPHAGMPKAAGDFEGDLQSLDHRTSGTSQSDVLEGLMAHVGSDAGRGSAGRDPAQAVFRGRADTDLARIIEVWPRLSSRMRAAMITVLDGQVKPPAIAGKRRSRKPVNSAAGRQ